MKMVEREVKTERQKTRNGLAMETEPQNLLCDWSLERPIPGFLTAH